jgi:group I intron endonuclease
MNTSCSLYKVTNLVNKKVYIGMSTQPKTRWRQHVSRAAVGGKQALPCAIRKYGEGAFAFDVLLTEHGENAVDLCRDAESLLIDMFDCRSPNGYNLTDGGEGVVGYKYSKEQNIQQSKRISKYFESPEARSLTAEKSKAAWDSKREACLGSRAKKVLCVETGQVFDSTASAGRWLKDKTGIGSQSLISSACSGKIHHARGFHWKFAKEDVQDQIEAELKKISEGFYKRKTNAKSIKKLMDSGYVSSKSIPVICVETGKTFSSATTAARILKQEGVKGSQSGISAVCRGVQETAFGYHWQLAK